LEEKDCMIAKWAQEDVETLDNLLNNNIRPFLYQLMNCSKLSKTFKAEITVDCFIGTNS